MKIEYDDKILVRKNIDTDECDKCHLVFTEKCRQMDNAFCVKKEEVSYYILIDEERYEV